MGSKEEHTRRAEAAYIKYQILQEHITAFELKVNKMYPDNDRQAAWYLKNSDETEAWVYRVRCNQRDTQQKIISTETAMLKLYS